MPHPLQWPEELIDEIGTNCSIYVGAGLSKPAGYPDWRELIEKMAQEAGIPSDEALASGGRPLLRLAENCRVAMGEKRYHDFLRGVFHRHSKDTYRDIHIHILNIPFNAFLTTNFDPCLQNASREVEGERRVHVYPILPAGDVQNGCIYHLHGRAYDENGKSNVGTIVLTQSDYDEAYDSNSELRSLLREVLVHQRVLFVGVSLRDPALQEALKASSEEYWILSENASRRGRPPLRRKQHFALRPMIFKRGLKALGREETRDYEAEQREAMDWQQWDVSITRYHHDTEDERHSQLTDDFYKLRRSTGRAPPGRTVTYRSLYGEQ